MSIWSLSTKGAVVQWLARQPGMLETRVQSPSAHPPTFPPQGSMAGTCNPACMGEGKMLWEESHSSGTYGAYVMQHCLGLERTIGGAGSRRKLRKHTSGLDHTNTYYSSQGWTGLELRGSLHKMESNTMHKCNKECSNAQMLVGVLARRLS